MVPSPRPREAKEREKGGRGGKRGRGEVLKRQGGDRWKEGGRNKLDEGWAGKGRAAKREGREIRGREEIVQGEREFNQSVGCIENERGALDR
jgi:hypothetical protein